MLACKRWRQRSGLALSLALLSLSGGACQVGLSSGDSLSFERGGELWGWTDVAQGSIRVEAFDGCEQAWRSVQQGNIHPNQDRLASFSGYPWTAPLIPASFTRPECLIGEGQSIELRVVQEQGEKRPPRTLAQLDASDQECLLAGFQREVSARALLQECVRSERLSLRLEAPSCPPGRKARVERISPAFAGSTLKVANFGDPSRLPVAFAYHYPRSLLSGKAPGGKGYIPEYRAYVGYLVPPERRGEIRGAWFSLFANFSTGRCDHRQDIGCAYASADRSERLSLQLLPRPGEHDPPSIPEGWQGNSGSAVELFDAIGAGLAVAEIELDREDVDRWFEMPISMAGIKQLQELPQEDALLFGFRVSTLDFSEPQKREWLLVDHLLDVSLTQEISPKLNLLFCDEV